MRGDILAQESGFHGRILVVDRDEDHKKSLDSCLSKEGFLVDHAGSYEEMRRAVACRFFDIALVDIHVDSEKGFEVIAEIISVSPYTKIIIMSDNGTAQFAVRAMKKGASSYISKSKEPRDIVARLKSELHTFQGDDQDDSSSVGDFGIIGESLHTRELRQKIDQVRDAESNVLIVGPSGTGKELVARAIHNTSKRRKGRFAAVNCSAIPENLLESELFGHKKGAFTGAVNDREGIFQACSLGTLLLDEIGDMPQGLQAKLLRVLQEREVTPVGSNKAIQVDTRILAATNCNVREMIKAGTFRDDLYYRLAVLTIELHPLKDRPEDIPVLANYFLDENINRFSKPTRPISDELMSRLVAHDWPGNVRELQNCIERGVVLSKEGSLRFEDMLPHKATGGSPSTEASKGGELADIDLKQPLTDAKRDFEKEYLKHLLETTRGNISEIAKISDRYRADIYRLLTKHGLDWEEFRD